MLKGWSIFLFLLLLTKARHFLLQAVDMGKDVRLSIHGICRNSSSFPVTQGYNLLKSNVNLLCDAGDSFMSVCLCDYVCHEYDTKILHWSISSIPVGGK